MKSLSCILIDDDSISLTILSKLIEEHGVFNVSGSFKNPVDALNFINSNRIDLVVVDIELEEVNGLDVLKEFPRKIPAIVVSAHDEYGVQAFEASVIDYVMKPIQKLRLVRALNKAKDEILKQSQSSSIEEAIFIKKNDSYIKIQIGEILYLKSDGDYIEIHTVDHKYLIIGTMDSILTKIGSSDFIRVHRSYSVALSKVQSFQDYDLYIGKNAIPVSKSYLKVVKDSLNIL